jgi:hypothetical protein
VPIEKNTRTRAPPPRPPRVFRAASSLRTTRLPVSRTRHSVGSVEVRNRRTLPARPPRLPANTSSAGCCRAALPRSGCSPSCAGRLLFCVTSVKSGMRRSRCASASCPRSGAASTTSFRRHSYHSHTRRGSLANASGVANSCGSQRSQKPVWASRKVGTPLSAEMPEPVSATTRSASRRAWIRSDGKSGAPVRFNPRRPGANPSLRRQPTPRTPRRRSSS